MPRQLFSCLQCTEKTLKYHINETLFHSLMIKRILNPVCENFVNSVTQVISYSLETNEDNVNTHSDKDYQGEESSARETFKNSLHDQNGLAPTKNETTFKWLEKFISGQDEAKRALITIVSCRNRRNKLSEGDLKNSIRPSHAIFHGPTGCGKSLLISKLCEYIGAPYIKTEATQYTEVGYVGKDVENMIKELMDYAISLVKKKHIDQIKESVIKSVYNALASIIVKSHRKDNTESHKNGDKARHDKGENESEELNIEEELENIARDDLTEHDEVYRKLKNGEFDDLTIEIELPDEQTSSSSFEIPGSNSTIQMSAFNVNDIMNKILGKKNTKIAKTKIKDAIELLKDEEIKKHLSEAQIISEAKHLAQNKGIIFIDEIDKIISSHQISNRGDVSKEGVQRDLLPLLDGTRINTKYGPIKTDHILFIAAGAFHVTKFSDLLPELQGRFPMSVKLHPLNEKHFVDILNNKEHSLIKQHKAMLGTDNVQLVFTEESINTIAKITAQMNQEVENTGARRLRTIIDKILEDIHFDAEKHSEKEFVIDSEYIKNKVSSLTNDVDLKKYII